MNIAKTRGEKTFDVINIGIMCVIIFITLYPFWFVIVGSFTEGLAYVRARGVFWWPAEVTLQNYRVVFREPGIANAFQVTIMRTAVGMVTHLLVTGLFAYAFSKTYLVGRKLYAIIGLITMFFAGGVIPSYLLRDWLGLLDTFTVFWLPAMVNFFNVVIFRAFFATIPEAIPESAYIDGAGDYRIFFKLILPLSAPVFAAIALFVGVWHWNDFMQPLLFTSSRDLETVPLLLIRTIRSAEAASGMASRAAGIGVPEHTINPLTIQMATMVVAVAPIVFLYPFLQKHFVKGVLLGSIKG